MTAFRSLEIAIDAMRCGAWDYIAGPVFVAGLETYWPGRAGVSRPAPRTL